MTEDGFYTAPVLNTILDGLVVQRPEGEAQPPQMGENGSVSVGRDVVDGTPVIMFALHHPDGATLVGTLGMAATQAFCALMNHEILVAFTLPVEAELKQ